jgi:hypothetical protein
MVEGEGVAVSAGGYSGALWPFVASLARIDGVV